MYTLLNVTKILDICLTAAAFISAFFIKKYLMPEPYRGLSMASDYYSVLLLIIIIWYVTFSLFNIYSSYRKKTFSQVFWDMVKAIFMGMVLLSLFMYLFKITDISRIMIVTFFFLNIGLLGLSKGTVYKVLSHYRTKGFNFRNILIIGSRERTKDVIDAMGDHLGSGYRITGCLEVDEGEVGKEVKNGIQIIGTLDNLEKFLLEKVVDELVFAMPLKKVENPKTYMAIAEEIGVSVRIVPDWQIHKLMYNPDIASIQFEEFFGISTIKLMTTPQNHGDLLIKSAFDYVFASMAMLLLLPLFMLIGTAIKLSSRGPVFFKQERCGLNGRRFMFYKFRTMVADAEAIRQQMSALNEMDGPVFKIKNDPRIIPFIGTLLRTTSLDELPQLINTIRGEMSLVGPRPPIPAEVDKYDIWQRRRLSMKPGMSCIWQTTPNRNEISFKQWMKLDLEYIDNWSLGLDFKILFKTAWVVLKGAGR